MHSLDAQRVDLLVAGARSGIQLDCPFGLAEVPGLDQGVRGFLHRRRVRTSQGHGAAIGVDVRFDPVHPGHGFLTPFTQPLQQR